MWKWSVTITKTKDARSLPGTRERSEARRSLRKFVTVGYSRRQTPRERSVRGLLGVGAWKDEERGQE